MSDLCSRVALVSILTVLVIGSGSPRAAWAQQFQVSGNARFQYDAQGFAIPMITGSGQAPILSSPVGKIVATPSATVQQLDPGGGAPRNLTIHPNRLTAPAFAADLPLYLFNSAVFQIRTSLSGAFPRSTAVFQASGRTGAPVETFQVPNVGMVRYERLANQFGGPARPSFGGTGDVALRVASPAPCSGLACQAIFKPNTPLSAFGGPFGFISSVNLPAPSPGRYTVRVTPVGAITFIGAPQGAGLSHVMTHFAGPWTTGRVTVSVPFASPADFIVVSGSDNRTPDGLGTISLVSGGIVQRNAIGPAAAVGWLNLTIVPEPALGWQLVAGLGMLEWLRRRRQMQR